MENEIWKEIPGFNGKYIASNTGKIRTTIEFLDNPMPSGVIRRQKNRHFRKDTLVGPKLSTKGYPRVRLEKKTYSVHRLIALTFLNNPENKEQINHIDGNKLNNNVNNLEWVSNQENRNHAVNKKLHAFGSGTGTAKLTEDDIPNIFKLRDMGLTQLAIAIKFHLTQQTISRILLKKTWKHVKV